MTITAAPGAWSVWSGARSASRRSAGSAGHARIRADAAQTTGKEATRPSIRPHRNARPVDPDRLHTRLIDTPAASAVLAWNGTEVMNQPGAEALAFVESPGAFVRCHDSDLQDRHSQLPQLGIESGHQPLSNSLPPHLWQNRDALQHPETPVSVPTLVRLMHVA